MEYEEINASWGKVVKDDLVECGTFSRELSLVMARQDVPGHPDKIALWLREPSSGRERKVIYDRTFPVHLRRPRRP